MKGKCESPRTIIYEFEEKSIGSADEAYYTSHKTWSSNFTKSAPSSPCRHPAATRMPSFNLSKMKTYASVFQHSPKSENSPPRRIGRFCMGRATVEGVMRQFHSSTALSKEEDDYKTVQLSQSTATQLQAPLDSPSWEESSPSGAAELKQILDPVPITVTVGSSPKNRSPLTVQHHAWQPSESRSAAFCDAAAHRRSTPPLSPVRATSSESPKAKLVVPIQLFCGTLLDNNISFGKLSPVGTTAKYGSPPDRCRAKRLSDIDSPRYNESRGNRDTKCMASLKSDCRGRTMERHQRSKSCSSGRRRRRICGNPATLGVSPRSMSNHKARVTSNKFIQPDPPRCFYRNSNKTDRGEESLDGSSSAEETPFYIQLDIFNPSNILTQAATSTETGFDPSMRDRIF
jgi:hypothetical protein